MEVYYSRAFMKLEDSGPREPHTWTSDANGPL